MDFLIAGSAAVAAGIITNPLDVLKIRMQLQGELKAKGQHFIHYKNIIHAAYTIVKHDGLSGLQKGLAPALGIQFLMNGIRLGVYRWSESKGLMLDDKGNLIFHRNLLIGGLGGVAGRVLTNPLFLIKTQVQAQSVQSIAVGYQHQHTSSWKGLRKIFIEYGIKGLFRGTLASIPKAVIGSISQLTTFAYTKQYLNELNYFKNRHAILFWSSMVGGIAIAIVLTPLDLILTRLYNQPLDINGKGLIYKNYMNCVLKIYQAEGISAFYKGFGPHYLRIGPHSVLSLFFWEEFNYLYKKYGAKISQ